MKPIDCTFAILDVKKGRKDLEKRLKSGERIYVLLLGTITVPHSRDDGESIEFQLEVEHLKELNTP